MTTLLLRRPPYCEGYVKNQGVCAEGTPSRSQIIFLPHPLPTVGKSLKFRFGAKISVISEYDVNLSIKRVFLFFMTILSYFVPKVYMRKRSVFR